ncbi:MAG: HPr kinase/phosphorylase, partial [Clostridia bacterium]|nr:HPr kinase/phosphorylase [Clostridia bacterium]
MKQVYQIPLSKVAEDHHLEVVVRPAHFDQIQITSPEVNRPGLALAGFYEIFDKERIQLIGKAEMQYLNSLNVSTKRLRLQQLVDADPVAILYTTGMAVDEAIIERATKKGVPILRTSVKTSPIMASLISSLNTHLAPRITRHGGLVEVYGEGMLLLGDSGIGKSETAIELIKRGHRLIADDAVEIKRVSDRTLVGSAPEIIRH